jgi:peptidoglycan/LPS O-acetylase OafA/YrhL
VLLLLIVCFVPRRHVLKAMAAAAASVILRIHTVVSGGNLVGAFMLPVCRMDGFMLGGIIAILYSTDQLSWVGARVLDGLIILCSVAFVAMTCCDVNLFGRFAITFGFAFYAFFFGAIVARVVKGGSFGILSSGPLAWVGTVSYFVYLAHLPILYATSFVPCGAIPNLLMTSVIVFGAAAISWRWMEKPLTARGRSVNAALGGSQAS